MNVKVVSKDKEHIELKLEGEDEGFAQWVAHTVLEAKGANFASGVADHPITANPVLSIRGKDAKKELHEALEGMREELEDLGKKLEKELPPGEEREGASAS